MGIMVTIGDILATAILLICVIGGGILYLRVKWINWRLACHKRKESHRKQQAMVDAAKK